MVERPYAPLCNKFPFFRDVELVERSLNMNMIKWSIHMLFPFSYLLGGGQYVKRKAGKKLYIYNL